MISKSGIIFDTASLRKRKKNPLRVLGYGLLMVSFAGIFFNFYPVFSAELSFRTKQIFNNSPKANTGLSGFGFLNAQAAYAKEEDHARELARRFGLVNTDFSIYVPKINARAEIAGNIDPSDSEAMKKALTQKIAHAVGSVFPGMDGGTYLFAHSTDTLLNITRYNAVFFLLRELENGDEIYVFFLDRVYKYKVAEKKIVDGNDTSWLTGAKNGPQRLILQTCWPPGTAWKRLIVVAYPIEFDK